MEGFFLKSYVSHGCWVPTHFILFIQNCFSFLYFLPYDRCRSRGIIKNQKEKKKQKKTLLRWWKFVQSFICSIRELYGSPVKWNHLIRRWYKYSTEVLQLNSVIATWSINCVFLYAVCSYKIASVWSIVPSILLPIFSGNSSETV